MERPFFKAVLDPIFGTHVNILTPSAGLRVISIRRPLWARLAGAVPKTETAYRVVRSRDHSARGFWAVKQGALVLAYARRPEKKLATDIKWMSGEQRYVAVRRLMYARSLEKLCAAQWRRRVGKCPLRPTFYVVREA